MKGVCLTNVLKAMRENAEAMKPCPFCGGKAVLMPEFSNFDPKTQIGTWMIGCEKCCICSFTGVDSKGAIEAWNRRTGARHDD